MMYFNDLAHMQTALIVSGYIKIILLVKWVPVRLERHGGGGYLKERSTLTDGIC